MRRWAGRGLLFVAVWVGAALPMPPVALSQTPPATAAGEGCFLALEDGRCLPPPASAPGAAPPSAAGARAARGPAVLVKRREAIPPAAFRSALAAAGFPGAEALALPRWWRAPVPPGQDPEALARRLQAHPAVETAEVDREVHALFTPNDPYYGIFQWNLPQIRAPQAWDLVTGTASVGIAVVDTGVDYYHPDLASSRLWLGYDFANDDSDPMDDHGHGTHVAGIAAANTNNGIGVAGVCWGCDILAVKVLGADGSGSVSWVASGIRYAADWGAAWGKRTVINLSLGGPDDVAVLRDAVAYARSKGALIVAAAGNDNTSAPFYPAAYPGVIGVSAVDDNDQKAWFSNYGPYVDLAAPGVDILSTIPSNDYGWASGTSMAAPHVAGVAGLLWSIRPMFTADQVCEGLLRTAADLGPPGRDDFYGYGRVDAYAAVRPFGPPLPPPGPYRAYLPLVLRGTPFQCP